jgi:hypothetical protein
VASAPVLAVLDRTAPFGTGSDSVPTLSADDVRDLAEIPAVEDALVEVAGDASQTPARRQAAAEGLLQGPFVQWRSSSAGSKAVASALAAGLAADDTHNRWGLPGHFSGRLGDALLSLGDDASDALTPLLDDDRRLEIEGSEEATLDEQAGYRICDLAAYLLSRLDGAPWDAPADVRRRSAYIDGLKAKLSAA